MTGMVDIIICTNFHVVKLKDLGCSAFQNLALSIKTSTRFPSSVVLPCCLSNSDCRELWQFMLHVSCCCVELVN